MTIGSLHTPLRQFLDGMYAHEFPDPAHAPLVERPVHPGAVGVVLDHDDRCAFFEEWLHQEQRDPVEEPRKDRCPWRPRPVNQATARLGELLYGGKPGIEPVIGARDYHDDVSILICQIVPSWLGRWILRQKVRLGETNDKIQYRQAFIKPAS